MKIGDRVSVKSVEGVPNALVILGDLSEDKSEGTISFIGKRNSSTTSIVEETKVVCLYNEK